MRWLEWNGRMELSEDDRAALELEYDSFGPPQPEPYSILLRLRRFNLNWWSGGYSSQPWLLMHELNACIDAEIEYDNLKLVNMSLEAKKVGVQNGT